MREEQHMRASSGPCVGDCWTSESLYTCMHLQAWYLPDFKKLQYIQTCASVSWVMKSGSVDQWLHWRFSVALMKVKKRRSLNEELSVEIPKMMLLVEVCWLSWFWFKNESHVEPFALSFRPSSAKRSSEGRPVSAVRHQIDFINILMMVVTLPEQTDLQQTENYNKMSFKFLCCSNKHRISLHAVFLLLLHFTAVTLNKQPIAAEFGTCLEGFQSKLWAQRVNKCLVFESSSSWRLDLITANVPAR